MASVLVPLAQGCEELEAITVVDLLRRAGISVVTAGLDEKPVRASRGMVLVPDTTLDEALNQEYDMVVLPGGLPGADHLDGDPRIRGLLKDMAARDRYTAAICAAPKVLASTGLLEGKKVTSFPVCWMLSTVSITVPIPLSRMASLLPHVAPERPWISP
jgi:4-methyl-5(b-hydroxyethyl)-thiazole monophosphate biosynthesis